MLYLSLSCAFFIYMLDYGLGKPGDEKPLYGSLLFAWSFSLAKKALGKKLYTNLYQQYRDQLTDDPLHNAQVRASFKEIVFTQARELFTWQKIVGMCPICTHFWFTMIAFVVEENIFYFKVNIITFSFYFLLSHVIIRFLKRWI